MESLLVEPRVVEALHEATDVVGIGRVVRTAARSLANADGATFVLSEGSYCFYEDEDAIAPLWKGQRFPQDHCISGWAMIHGQAAVVRDILVDERIPLEAYAPTFVKSLVAMPVGRPAVAAIGAYWARVHQPSATELAGLEDLAWLVAEAIDRVGIESAPWAPNFGLR